MLTRSSVAILLALSLFLWTQTAVCEGRERTTENRELSLSVGENHTLPAKAAQSYSEGVEGIAEVRLTPDGKEFVIVGRKPGQTTLLVLQKDGRQVLYAITVYPRPMDVVEAEIAQLLADDTGLRIRRVGPRLFIEGGVSTEPELRRIEQISALYPGQVSSLVVLGGTAAQRKHNIRLDIMFIQLDRSRSFDVGVRWPGTIGPAALTAKFDLLRGAFSQATAQVVEQPLLALDFAQSQGWAKVLKHSTVITGNGTEAMFASGGEQSYRVVGGLAAELKQLAFGTTVKVLPRFDPTKRELEVHVEAEVADLTAPVAPGTDLPGRNVTQLTTHVTLKLGQALVLSGIQTSAQRRRSTGIPGLSQIPLIGALFGGQQAQREELEGAVYLVPSVVEAISRPARTLVNELIDAYQGYEGKKSQSRRPYYQEKP